MPNITKENGLSANQVSTATENQQSNSGTTLVSEQSFKKLNEVLIRKPYKVKRLKIHFYTSEVRLQGFSQKHVVSAIGSTFDEAMTLFLEKVCPLTV